LVGEKGGKWTIPPYYIDSVAHLAGFILNGGDARDPKNNFYVTPGWKSMCFAKPLVPGGKYRSYVKMEPMAEQGFYSGDVYVLQGDDIIGVVGGIKFRTFPRLLLSNLFSPPDKQRRKEAAHTKTHTPIQEIKPQVIPTIKATRMLIDSGSSKGVAIPQVLATKTSQFKTGTTSDTGGLVEQAVVVTKQDPLAIIEETVKSVKPQSSIETDGETPPIVAQVISLIATETALDIEELTDDTCFANIGVDSLLSLVLAEKFREEMKMEVQSSLFLECPTIKDLKEWLMEC